MRARKLTTGEANDDRGSQTTRGPRAPQTKRAAIVFAGVLSSTVLASSWAATPAWAGTSVLEDVKVVGGANRLTIELHGDGVIPADGARVKTDTGVVYLYVKDTRVHGDRRSWSTEEGGVKAHRHRGEIELVVPTGGRDCAANAGFETTQTGLTVILTCSGGSDEAPAPRARRTRRIEAEAEAETPTRAAPVPVPAAAPAAIVVSKAATRAALKESASVTPGEAKAVAALAAEARPPEDRAALAALVALPEEGGASPAAKAAAPANVAKPTGSGDDKPAGTKATKLETKPETKAETKPAPALAAAANRTAAPAETQASLAPATVPAGAAPASRHEDQPEAASAAKAAGTDKGPGSVPFGAPFIAVLALGGGGFLWWRKKQGLVPERRIQIKETASLGPKRSLVVAEVDGERLILASSEAGITLLRSDKTDEMALMAAFGRSEGSFVGPLPREPGVGSSLPGALAARGAPVPADSTSVAARSAAANLGAFVGSVPSSVALSAGAEAGRVAAPSGSRGDASPAPVAAKPALAPERSSLSEAAAALFRFPGKTDATSSSVAHHETEHELEGAASGLLRLRALTGGRGQEPARSKPPQPEAVAAETEQDILEERWFAEALEESVEDQELRAKMASGLGGRA